MQEVASSIASLPDTIWAKWAPIVYAFPRIGDKDAGIHLELLRLAYDHAPEEIIKSILAEIDYDNKNSGVVDVPRRLRDIWDERLARSLLTKVKDTTLKPAGMEAVLNELLHQAYAPAQTFAEALITNPLPTAGVDRERARIAARLLITYAKNVGWPTVWSALQRDVNFGREVVEAVSHGGDRHGQSMANLSENQLADLYIWVEQQFPHAEDPKYESGEFYTVGPRESVAEWRDSILRHLKSCGTVHACDEIMRIAQEFPHLDWLKWTLYEAQANMRRTTWQPPSPHQVLRLTLNQDARLVQNGKQLLLVILESLGRLQAKLHDEMPAAIDLWNEVKGNYSPKDENRLSDYVKRHLDQDLNQRGVVINREVVIRRGTGDDGGERTDVHVNAVIRDASGKAFDVITVIIEVKGCWHRELLSAMETQLVQRYLKDNRCRQGMYLVGWFYCPQWEKTPRKLGSKGSLQKRLDSQAAEMAKYSVDIRAFVLDATL